MECIHERPENVGFDTYAWTVPLAKCYIEREFDVEYCERHIRRLMTQAGLSVETARPQYVNADDRVQEAFREGFKKKLSKLDDEYTVVATNQTRQELTNLVYAWFPEGERPTPGVSGVWENLKLLRGVTDDGETFYLPCEDNFTGDPTIRLLDAL